MFTVLTNRSFSRLFPTIGFKIITEPSSPEDFHVLKATSYLNRGRKIALFLLDCNRYLTFFTHQEIRQMLRPPSLSKVICNYLIFAKVSFTALKFGKSFGVGVCSLYCTTPFLSMTNAARAAVSPTPANIGKTTS